MGGGISVQDDCSIQEMASNGSPAVNELNATTHFKMVQMVNRMLSRFYRSWKTNKNGHLQ